ncbi:BTB/POZ domain protein [Trichuris suis]|nr:BTB/POZ domain protein [Trichuris suis]
MDTELVEAKSESDDASKNLITTKGELLKLHYDWKPMYFPFRKYLLWGSEPMASQTKVFYSDDQRYALRLQLDWVSKRFQLVVLQEPSPSLYKLKVRFDCKEGVWVEKTNFLTASEASFPWLPDEAVDASYLNISSYVTVLCGVTKPGSVDSVVSEHVKMMITGTKRLFDLSSSNAFAACCDFTFKVEDKLLMVHKAIMGVMSPKLSQIMFEKNTQQIDGVSFEGLNAFVQCIYTGQYEVRRCLIPDVMVLSRRYELNWIAVHFRDVLLKECLRMCVKLGYRSNSLLHTFRKFVHDILRSQHWKDLSNKHPECAAYILQDAFLVDSNVFCMQHSIQSVHHVLPYPVGFFMLDAQEQSTYSTVKLTFALCSKMSSRESDDLIEKAKSIAAENAVVQNLLRRYYSMESKLSRLHFLMKQNKAELRKMLRNVEAEGAVSRKKKKDDKRLSRTDTAKVKDIRMADRGRMDSASVEIHPSVSRLENVNSQPNLESFDDQDANNQSDSVIAKLRAEVTRLTRENFRLNSALSDSDRRSPTFAPASAAEGGSYLCNNCEKLKEQLESKETNLLRSENHIQQLRKTIAKLEEQLSLMRKNGKAEESQESIDAFVTASTPHSLEGISQNEKEDKPSPFLTRKHRQKAFHHPPRQHRINRYCLACHRMKRNHPNRTPKRRHPVKPLYSMPTVRPNDARNDVLLSNYLSDEYDRLTAENAKLIEKCSMLEKRNETLEDLVRDGNLTEATRLECSNCGEWKRKHDNLFRSHRALIDRFEAEKSRHEANYTLLDGQKLKLEKDVEKLKENSSVLQRMNKTLRSDLLVAERCALELQRLMAENGAKKSVLADLKKDMADKATDVPEWVSLRKEPEYPAGSSAQPAATINAKGRDQETAELKKMTAQLEAEYSKFQSKLADQEASLYRMTKALESATDARKSAEYSRNAMEAELLRQREEHGQLSQTVKNLENDLRQALIDKEYWQSALRSSIDQLHNFESLMHDREEEYQRMLKEAKSPLNASGNANSEIQLLNVEKQNLLKEVEIYREQFSKTRAMLKELEADRDAMLKQNESFQRDVADLRQSVLNLESDNLSLLQRLTLKETESSERKRQLENLNLELKLLRCQPELSDIRRSQLELEVRELKSECAKLRCKLTDCERKLKGGKDEAETVQKKTDKQSSTPVNAEQT